MSGDEQNPENQWLWLLYTIVRILHILQRTLSFGGVEIEI
jgi:hypothetical protein